jgi:hypothetical protein
MNDTSPRHIPCKNCDRHFSGDYCSHCGQKVIGRFTTVFILRLIIDDLFEVNRGLLYTLKELWINPGYTALNYINGQTQRYYGPLKYLIFWTALILILTSFFNDFNTSEPVGSLLFNMHAPFSRESVDDFFTFLMHVFVPYINFVYMGLVPFLALTGYVIYFNRKYNFTEFIILYLYLCGQISFLLVIALLVLPLIGEQGAVIFTVLTIIPVFYLLIKMHKQIFNQNWFLTIVKSLAVFYVGEFLYSTFAFMVVNLIKMATY